MLELLAVLVLGICFGVITGLLPGLHPNAVIALLLPVYFAWQPPVLLFVAFVTGVGVVHTFVSFIPSVLLGAPDSNTALSVLPGHQYLLEGKALEAIGLTVYGGVVTACLAVLLIPVMFYTVAPVYELLSPYMHILLGLVLVSIVYRADTRIATTGIILLSGALGIIVLNSPAVNTQYALFPLFSGLFGASTILIALQQGAVLPEQGNSSPVKFRETFTGGVYGFGAGLLAGFLPGIGSSQSALIIDEAVEMTQDTFMTTLGGITTADLFLSIIALHVIGNPRSGTAVAIQQVSDHITTQLLVQTVGFALIAIAAGALITRELSHRLVFNLHRIPYQHLLYGVLALLALGTVALTGPYGVIILITATALGIAATLFDVNRSTCMAALIIPTILYYMEIAVVSLF